MLVSSYLFYSLYFFQDKSEKQLITEIISQVSEAEIRKSVVELQNFGTRVYGSPGNIAASKYIHDRLASIPGLDVEYQGDDLRNIIATLPGEDSSSNEIYVVGAHYDCISTDLNNAPGVTDNASGVAIVLEFARIMSKYSYKHTLKFAFWNNEENGYVGSQNYAAFASNNNLKISLYVNLDSSSYDPDNNFILDIMYNDQSEWAANIFTEYNVLYNIGFTLTYNVHLCTSDHVSFRQNGYAAVMTHEELHGPAHTSIDTIDKVSLIYAKKNGQLCMSVLVRSAKILL